MIEESSVFTPHPEFKTLMYTYLFLILLGGVLWWYIPLLIFVPLLYGVIFAAIILLVFGIPAAWISLYYDSISYELTDDEIVWRRGVWFRRTGVVPYNRITNVDISQGPISRVLGIAYLKIQTAGYSPPSGGPGLLSEIRIDGRRDFNAIHGQIMDGVRNRRPISTESGYGAQEESSMLGEVRKIRQILEDIRRE